MDIKLNLFYYVSIMLDVFKDYAGIIGLGLPNFADLVVKILTLHNCSSYGHIEYNR